MEATVENKQTLSLLWRRPETKVVQEARFTFYAFFLIVPLLSPETLWNTVLNISFSQAFALLWFCDYSDVCLKSSFLFPQVQPSESCALMMNWIAKSLLFWSGEKVMSHLSGPENIYPVYIWTIVYSWSIRGSGLVNFSVLWFLFPPTLLYYLSLSCLVNTIITVVMMHLATEIILISFEG